jgi:PilZ domain
MSPMRAEAKVEYPGIQNIRRDSPKANDRRRRIRRQAKWPVSIWAPNTSAPVEALTTNLSSDGFHCLSPVPLKPDEIVACTLTIPEISIQPGGPRRVLECRVRIVRLEPPNEDGDFGIGCRIENFRIATASRRSD